MAPARSRRPGCGGCSAFVLLVDDSALDFKPNGSGGAVSFVFHPISR